jgi:PAS domain S-box-containing protein
MVSAFATTNLNRNSQPTQMAEALCNLQHAVEQCHDGVFMTDSTGLITRVNPAFEQFIGYTATELVGKDLSLVFDSKSESAEYQLMWRRIFEETQYTGTVKLTTKSGQSVEAEWIITPVHGSRGRVVSLVGTSRAVTAPQEATALAQSAPNNERLFHDLRNILMIVVAYSELAREGLPAGHLCRRYVESAATAAQSAAALINDSAQPGGAAQTHSSTVPPLGTEKDEHATTQASLPKKKSKSEQQKPSPATSDHVAGG